MSELTMPPGNPDVIEQAARDLGSAVGGVGDLGGVTGQAMTAIKDDAEWTGSAADAYTAFTGGLADGVKNMQAPLDQVPALMYSYASALRSAQNQVRGYQGYVNQAVTGARLDPDVVNTLAGDAQSALAALQETGQAAVTGLNRAAADLDGVFGGSGPFRSWLERANLPWDAAGADAVVEQFVRGGEADAKDAEQAAEFMKTLPAKLDSWFSDVVGGTMKDMVAGKAGLSELSAATDRWQSMRAAAESFGPDLAEESRLARLLPGLKILGGTMSGLGAVSGIYTMFSPPEYDKGALRTADRFVGGAAALSGGIGVAADAGVNFEALAIAGQSLDFVPGLGEVVAVGTGLYLAGDYIYHNTHQIAHAYDSARHTAAHVAGNVGHAAATGLRDLTGGLL